MNHEFTAEEIKQAARAARIYSPDLNEEKFESLMELARRAYECDYLETVRGVRRLEMEEDVKITEIFDACQELLEENKQLESRGADLELRLENLGELIKQAEQKYSQLQERARKAEEALAATIAQQEKQARQLETSKKKGEAEKRRIAKEVEDSHRKANVTREEVTAAGQIKVEVEKHGFTLELALSLAREFAGHGGASERLQAGLKKEGSLTRYLKELEAWGEKRRSALLSEMSHLEAQNEQLEDRRLQLQAVVMQLRADEAAENELRWYYRRFGASGCVLEQLAKWSHVYPLRCSNPLYAVAKAFNSSVGCARVWTDKPVSQKCPYCGLQTLNFDVEVYNALGIPVGYPIKINLGE